MKTIALSKGSIFKSYFSCLRFKHKLAKYAWCQILLQMFSMYHDLQVSFRFAVVSTLIRVGFTDSTVAVAS